MTSKSFKSAFSPDKVLRITGSPERICLAQRYRNDAESLVFIDSSAVPALALAILEAAGVEAVPFDEGTDTEPGHAVWALRHHVQEAEAKAAEARERAELEAEALELLNIHREAQAAGAYDKLDEVPSNAKACWLAVARRAREMRAEK